MKNKKRVWIITAFLALFTTGLVYVYLNQVAAASEANKVKTETVVVALTTIPGHVKVTADMLETKEIAEDAVHPDALTSIDEVVGGTTTTDLVAGEQILSERIVLDTGVGPLAYRVPENMRAITVPTTEVDSIGGYIMPGDKIDILARYPSAEDLPVVEKIQNIEVLEKGPYAAGVEGEQTGVPTSITILVSPGQADVIANASLNGSLYFTLRNPVDANIVE